MPMLRERPLFFRIRGSCVPLPEPGAGGGGGEDDWLRVLAKCRHDGYRWRLRCASWRSGPVPPPPDVDRTWGPVEEDELTRRLRARGQKSVFLKSTGDRPFGARTNSQGAAP